MAWEQFLNRWVPPGTSTPQQRQSRIIVTSAVVLAIITALYTVLYMVTGAWMIVGANLVALLACGLTPPLIARDRPVLGANVCTGGGYLCLTASVAISGGFEARFVFWLLIIPLIAGLLGGIRTGIAWAAVTAATLVTFAGLHIAGVRLPTLIPLDLPPAVVILQTFGMVLVITVVTVVFLRTQAWATEQTQRAIDELEAEVHQRRNAEQAALDASTAKSEFLARMSHELRTPMTGVLGMTQLLLRTELDARQRKFATTVRRSGDLLLELLNGILDFSKIEAGELRLEERTFCLPRTLESVAELCAVSAQKKGLELLLELDPSLPVDIVGDETRLRQMTMNLLSNAVKFTPEGEIVLTAEDRDEYLCISVRDTGIGIPLDKQAQLFSPFVQAEASTTRQYGGTGLGLAIVRSLAASMGGEAGVRSAPEGGSIFWFTFRKKVSSAIETPAPNLDRLAHCRILVVDDHPTSRRILHDTLSRWKLRVEVAANAERALARLHAQADRAEPFEIALLDMEMPGVDGLELSRRIEADPGLRRIRRILMSTVGRVIPDELTRDAGIEQQLFKPLSPQTLLEALLDADEATDEPPTSSTPDEGQALGSILVVDDNRINQMVIQHSLGRMGYRSRTAHDGTEAIRRLREGAYDAVLMDVQMPILDGYEATRQIRGDLGLKVPIIGLTASNNPEDRQRCLDAGMDDYLSKPLDIEALTAALAERIPPP